MSHTFTRKISRGEKQKILNAQENKLKEQLILEAEEAKKWEDPQKETKNDRKNAKMLKKEEEKKMREAIYEQEMN